MARYKITAWVESERIDAVRKKAGAVFGAEAEARLQVAKENLKPSRADRLGEAESAFEGVKEQIVDLLQEVTDWKENIPENLQEGDKAQEVEACIDSLQALSDELDNIDFGGIDFPSMF